MASVNKAIVLGNLGRDPELRHTGSGKAVATLRIATNEQWNDQSGERQERTEWHSVVVWGRQAETCNQYLKKGRTVYIEGRLQTRKWQDKEGRDRWSTEVVCDSLRFLGSRDGGGTRDTDSSSYSSSGGGGGGGGQAFANEDIPF